MSSAVADREYLTVEEAVDLFPADIRPSVITLYRWLREKRLPSVRVGGRIFVRPASVERYLHDGGAVNE
jgi:excisionase family DNA binding protein